MVLSDAMGCRVLGHVGWGSSGQCGVIRRRLGGAIGVMQGYLGLCRTRPFRVNVRSDCLG